MRIDVSHIVTSPPQNGYVDDLDEHENLTTDAQCRYGTVFEYDGCKGSDLLHCECFNDVANSAVSAHYVLSFHSHAKSTLKAHGMQVVSYSLPILTFTDKTNNQL